MFQKLHGKKRVDHVCLIQGKSKSELVHMPGGTAFVVANAAELIRATAFKTFLPIPSPLLLPLRPRPRSR